MCVKREEKGERGGGERGGIGSILTRCGSAGEWDLLFRQKWSVSMAKEAIQVEKEREKNQLDGHIEKE